MRKSIVVVLATLLVAPALFGQEPEKEQELYRRAIALHDAGDYDGAIAIYRQLLESMPANEQVRYELTFSTFAKGDMVETIRLATEGAKVAGPTQVPYLELLGNAYDSVKKPREAIAAYKRGIKIDPKYPRIHYNLGITYSGQNKFRDARAALEHSIELDPKYASPHLALAEVYRLDGYRVPAILAYGRFLSLEPASNRAQTAAAYLQALLNLGVKSEGEGNVNITIDPASKKDLGNFGPLEMMAAIAASSSYLSEKASMSEFDRQAEALTTFIGMFSEMSGDLRRGFIAGTYAPFYTAMVKAGHASAFAHVALAPLKLDGTEEWMSANAAAVSALDQFRADYGAR